MVFTRRAAFRKIHWSSEMRSQPTKCEALLWERLRRRGLKGFKFRRQAPLLGYITDFYCPERRLVVEVDGPYHQANKAYDDKRDSVMRSMGYGVLRFTNEQVETALDAVTERISRALWGQSGAMRAKRLWEKGGKGV